MKTNFTIEVKPSNKLEVNTDNLKVMSAANQLAAILANALGIANPISQATNKAGETFTFVSPETCQLILSKLSAS